MLTKCKISYALHLRYITTIVCPSISPKLLNMAPSKTKMDQDEVGKCPNPTMSTPNIARGLKISDFFNFRLFSNFSNYTTAKEI